MQMARPGNTRAQFNNLLSSRWFILICALMLMLISGVVAGNVHLTIAQLEQDKKVFDSQNLRSGVVSVVDVQRLLLIMQEALTIGEMTPALHADLRAASDMLYVRADSFYAPRQADASFPSPERVAGSMLRIVDAMDVDAQAGYPDLEASWTNLLGLAEQSRRDLVDHLDRVQRYQADLLDMQLMAVTEKRNVVWAALAGLMLFAISALVLLRSEILATKARQQAEARIRHLAFHDPLTGLPNRAQFQEHLSTCLDGGQSVTLMILDVDEFKLINDTYGHSAGDTILIHISNVLQEVASAYDCFVARLGGDEYALIVPQVRLPDATEICDLVMAQVRVGIVIEGEVINPQTSVGIATSTQIGASLHLDAEALSRAADFALYTAKSAGRGRYTVYDEALEVKFLARRKMVEELPGAIANGEMEIFLQPKLRLETSEIYGFEALVRWRRDGVLVPPDEFIATAEESGQIIDLDRSVLRRSCRMVADFNSTHGTAFSISVNFSALQFNAKRFCGVVQDVLADTGLPAHLLIIEVTETAEFGDLEQAKPIISALQSLGVRIAIDDFGVGFSSLSYLRNTFADEVKFDRSLVKDIEHSSSSRFLLDSMIEIAHQLSLEVTIEGVETDSQLQIIAPMGAMNGQGYHWCKPLPAEDALQLAITQPFLPDAEKTPGKNIA